MIQKLASELSVPYLELTSIQEQLGLEISRPQIYTVLHRIKSFGNTGVLGYVKTEWK